MTKPGYVVVYAILICAMANGGSEGIRWKHDGFYKDHVGEKVYHGFYYTSLNFISFINFDSYSRLRSSPRDLPQ